MILHVESVKPQASASGPPSSREDPNHVTLARLAELTGVSLRVVTDIVNDRRSRSVRYSERTRQRVLETARKVGYRPNRSYRNHFRRRHGAVAVLAQSLGFIPERVLDLLTIASHRRDWLLVVERMSPEGKLPRVVRESCVDGLVLFSTPSPALVEAIDRFGIPAVQVNTNDRTSAGCVSFDEEGAVRQAMEAFAQRGRRRVAYVGPTGGGVGPVHYSVQLRPHAMAALAAEFGLEVLPPCACDFRHASAAGSVKAWLAEHPDADGLLLYTPSLAGPVWRAALEAGRPVPEAISVIVLGPGYQAGGLPIVPTELTVTHEALARQTIAALDAVVAGQHPEAVTLPYSLVPGETL